MGLEEKKRDEGYWQSFAESGRMPDLPEELVAEKGPDYVRSVLAAPYNDLSKLLLTEVLARRCELAADDQSRQCVSAKWVRVMIFSKKNGYERRTEMVASLAAFMESSKNPRLALMGGLSRAEATLGEKSRKGENVKEFADRCAARLREVVAENAENSHLEQFAQLVIAVGWEFVKAHDYAALGDVMSLVPDDAFANNAFISERMGKLRECLGRSELLPLRDWPSKAKEVFHALPGGVARVFPLLQELQGLVRLFDEMRKDEALRSLILFWLGAFLGRLKKEGNGLSSSLGELFVTVARADGLCQMPASCWERRVMNPPPAQGDGVFPATAEKLVNGLYSVVKEKYGRSRPGMVVDQELVEWLLGRMQDVYARLPDEKWGNFRLGKLLIVLGRLEEAKDCVLPVVRRNQTQFWAWDAMGQLFPEHRKACLAKALLCPEEEQKLVRVKREAAELGVPIDDADALKDLASEVMDLFLEGQKSVEGVLEARFKNKEGKDRIKFYLKDGSEVKPVSPGAVKLPRSAREGSPFNVYLDSEDPAKIIAVRPRQGTLWDVMPSAVVVYYGMSKKGNAMLGSESLETTCPPSRFPALQQATIGAAFNVHYSKCRRDYGMAYEIRNLERVQGATDITFAFEGPIRFPNGPSAAAFVGNVYIPPDMAQRFRDRGLTEGTPVSGRAIYLPARVEQDHFGKIRTRKRTTAVSLKLLGGEELERFRSQN